MDPYVQLASVVRIKAFDSMLTRTLVRARNQILSLSTQLSNQIRGLVTTFGLLVSKGTSRAFDGNVRELLAGNDDLARIIFPLLHA